MEYKPIFWFVEPSINLVTVFVLNWPVFVTLKREAVIESIDASTIYDVPNLMLEEGLDKVVLEQLNLESHTPDLTSWNSFLDKT